MPKRLPFKDIVSGLAGSMITALRYWFHYTVVAVAWLAVVPLTAYRIFKCLFNGSMSPLLTLPFDLLSLENFTTDEIYGCLIVLCTLCAFISVVWLRDQILRENPEWLEQAPEAAANDDALAEPANEDANQEANNQAFADDLDEEEIDELVLEADLDENAEDFIDAEGAADDGGAQMAIAQEDLNWNWERNAEELTWERVFGLDGSLVFLEHVFWVISLNTLFILIFAFCPYHFGLFLLSNFRYTQFVVQHRFEGVICTVTGYTIIGLLLVLLHALLFKCQRARRTLGLSYLIIKVALLSIFEIGVFPLICGWWLDICSLVRASRICSVHLYHLLTVTNSLFIFNSCSR
jgi:E3 ubiquitin-protein ligase MARCH6